MSRRRSSHAAAAPALSETELCDPTKKATTAVFVKRSALRSLNVAAIPAHATIQVFPDVQYDAIASHASTDPGSFRKAYGIANGQESKFAKIAKKGFTGFRPAGSDKESGRSLMGMGVRAIAGGSVAAAAYGVATCHPVAIELLKVAGGSGICGV
jgi:hypothetical protein